MPDTFTPEQIAQILEEFFKVVGTRQYIGARYVPIFGHKDEESIEWDNTAPYEPLTIVLYQGNSYTSRQFVPVGVEITNQEFWAITGNYNAQVEMYRRETAAAREVADNALTAANDAQADIDTLLPKADFSAENTVKDYVDDTKKATVNAFPNVAALVASDVSVGMTVCVEGFETPDDGGAADYRIESAPNGLIPIQLNNGLYANRFDEAEYNALSLGFKNDNATDNKPLLDAVTAFHAANGYKHLAVYFPSGVYRFSPTKIISHNFALRGCQTFNSLPSVQFGTNPYDTQFFTSGSTIFAPITHQAYVIQIGGLTSDERIDDSSVYCNNAIEHIAFTSIKENASAGSANKMYRITDACLVVCNQYMGNFNNLHFCLVLGSGIKQVYGYENRFDNLMFRYITPANNIDDGAFVFARSEIYAETLDRTISACHYGYMYFEFCYGSLLQVLNTGIGDCQFDGFSFEDGWQAGYNVTAESYESGEYQTVPLVNLVNDIDAPNEINIVFDSVSLNYMARFVFANDISATRYVHDIVVSAKEFDSSCTVKIAAVQCSSLSHRFAFFEGHSEKVGGYCNFGVGVMSRAPYGVVYDRSLYDYLRGYATCVDFDGMQPSRATSYRRNFKGFDSNNLCIAQSAMQVDANNKTKYPNMVIGTDSAKQFYLQSHCMLNLNIPAEIHTLTSQVNMYQFVMPCIGDKFTCIVYVPTDAQADLPIVDAFNVNGTRDNLTPTITRIFANLYRITLDTSAVAASHVICIGNDPANSTENALIEWMWA